MTKTRPNFPQFNGRVNDGDEFDIHLPEFKHLHAKALRWVAFGVYFGYPVAEIKALYRRISRGIPAPKGTMFSGTGYVMTESPSAVEEERDIYIAEINARRYHLMPFPDSSGELYTTIKMLLNCDPEFRSEVWEILEDL